MKKNNILSFIIIGLFVVSSAVNASSNTLHLSYVDVTLQLNSDLTSNINQTHLASINAEKQPIVKVSDELIDNRYTVFYNNVDDIENVIILDLDGNIVGAFPYYTGENEMIDSKTLMMDNRTHVSFWDLESNTAVHYEIPEEINKHHDIEYNKITGTFLYLGREDIGTVNVTGEEYPIRHDTIFEVNKDGDILWEWNSSIQIPFNQTHFYLTNSTRRGVADWTHGNSIYWDMTNDYIYYNARHLHSFYKIDKSTGDIVWQLGYLGDFTMYAENGTEKESLFYGEHDVQVLSENRFLIYDNDYLAVDNPDRDTTRFVEIEIDEEAMTAKEVWTWDAPYYGSSGGGVDKLPDGHYIGTFRAIKNPDRADTFLIEVNEDGDIVWQVNINNSRSFRSEQFYKAPLMNIAQSSFDVTDDQDIMLEISVWNSFREKIPSEALIKIYDFSWNKKILDKTIEFLPHWQETKLSINFSTTDFLDGTHTIEVTLENAEGLTTTKIVTVTVKRATKDNSSLQFVLPFIFTVAVIILLRKEKSN